MCEAVNDAGVLRERAQRSVAGVMQPLRHAKTAVDRLRMAYPPGVDLPGYLVDAYCLVAAAETCLAKAVNELAVKPAGLAVAAAAPCETLR